MRCIVTGISLVHGDRAVSGDLFDAGDCYVLNGNWRDGQIEWYPKNLGYSRQLDPSDWWERRGVFVIRKDQANLNRQALDYIAG